MKQPKRLRSIAVRYTVDAMDGKGAFAPLSHKAARMAFTDGELLFFRPDRKRFWEGHQAFMALIREAWESLPDEMHRMEFQTPDVLRRRLMIAAEFGTLSHIVCESDGEAQRQLALLSACVNDYTFLSIYKNVIVLAVAPSQAMDAMTEDMFEASCQGVRKQLAILLGCTENEIKSHAASLRARKLTEAEQV